MTVVDRSWADHDRLSRLLARFDMRWCGRRGGRPAVSTARMIHPGGLVRVIETFVRCPVPPVTMNERSAWLSSGPAPGGTGPLGETLAERGGAAGLLHGVGVDL